MAEYCERRFAGDGFSEERLICHFNTEFFRTSDPQDSLSNID